MAEGVENDVFTEDIVTKPVGAGTNSPLALAGFHAFKFLDIESPSSIERILLEDCFQFLQVDFQFRVGRKQIPHFTYAVAGNKDPELAAHACYFLPAFLWRPTSTSSSDLVLPFLYSA